MNIPTNEVPVNIDYQLVTVAVAGDRSLGRLKKFEENGWRRVPISRHPSIRSVDPKWIEAGGLALVERPKYLTDRAKVWEQNKADAQLLAVATTVVAGPNFRDVNMKATEKRKRTVKEFFVLHFWRARVWVRNKIDEWRS